jgi:hypothetical protein
MFDFEHRSEPLIPMAAFLRRMARFSVVAFLIIAAALLIGMLGYHTFQGLPWLDSFLNAAMILSGMGPVDAPKTSAGKLFAGCYALFSGVAFITTAGVLVTPGAHRLLHWFHINADDNDA